MLRLRHLGAHVTFCEDTVDEGPLEYVAADGAGMVLEVLTTKISPLTGLGRECGGRAGACLPAP